MTKRIGTVGVVFMMVVAFLASCDSGLKQENEQLTNQVDSLNAALNETARAVEALEDVGSLLDTLEAQRDIIRVEMVEGGMSGEDFAARIEALNEQYELAESRLSELESTQSTFNALVKKLRADLQERDQQIEALETLLSDFQAANTNMQATIVLQEDQIEELETEMMIADQELEFFELRIMEMVEVAQMNEADAFFARAVAYEEAANRTKFAPKKKKETLRHALELYQEALNLGKSEAQTKVDELSARLD